MSTTRIHAAIGALAATAVVLGGALTGCSVTRDDNSEPAQSSDTAEATDTASPEPTPSPLSPTVTTTPSDSATSSASTSAAATPLAALLSAAELPQLNDSSPWTEGRTGPATQRAFGLCQKFDVLSIGALSAVQRTFTSGKDTAAQQVVEFPDAQNTVRAGKVIEAWQRGCARRLQGTSVKVGPITDVGVGSGKGWWYLVSLERRGTGHFHSLGLVFSGSRMTLIRMDHDGQDHDYEPGKDPMELAVKAASARLG